MTACANLVHSDWVALALVNHPTLHFIVGDLESKYGEEVSEEDAAVLVAERVSGLL